MKPKKEKIMKISKNESINLLINVPLNVNILTVLFIVVWPTLEEMAGLVYPGYIKLQMVVLLLLALTFNTSCAETKGSESLWYAKMSERLTFNVFVSLYMLVLWMLK